MTTCNTQHPSTPADRNDQENEVFDTLFRARVIVGAIECAACCGEEDEVIDTGNLMGLLFCLRGYLDRLDIMTKPLQTAN